MDRSSFRGRGRVWTLGEEGGSFFTTTLGALLPLWDLVGVRQDQDIREQVGHTGENVVSQRTRVWKLDHLERQASAGESGREQKSRVR